MNAKDRSLGMHRKITRRDFVNGVAAGAAGLMLAGQTDAQEFAPEQSTDYYPPALTGMRGDHAGSFEAAHNCATGAPSIYRAPHTPTKRTTW